MGSKGSWRKLVWVTVMALWQSLRVWEQLVMVCMKTWCRNRDLLFLP